MIKENNTRIQLTLSKKQADWIRKQSKKLHWTTSKFIKFLMDKNIMKLMNIYMRTEEEEKEILRIIKTPWIDLDDDN